MDSGSNKTIVRSDAIEARQIPKAEFELCGVTGHRIPLQGPVDVELQVGAASVRHSVYVADVEDPCILGLDFLTKYKCKINMSNLTMEIAGVNVALEMQAEGTAHSYRIKTQRAIRVPPMTEMVVDCCAEGFPDSERSQSALIEGKDGVGGGLLVGRTLVDCGKKSIPALVANISDKSINLSAITVLGTCQPVDHVEEMKETPPEGVKRSGSLPEHLRDLYTRSSSELSPREAQELQNLLTTYADVFSKGDGDLGCTD